MCDWNTYIPIIVRLKNSVITDVETREEKIAMSQMMNALVKTTPEKGLTLTRVPVPVTGKNDVKIKISKTSICGTDVHIYNWDQWSQRTIKTPMTIGHEFVGRIVEVGENVTAYQVGDRVSGEGHIICHTCRNCLEGQ